MSRYLDFINQFQTAVQSSKRDISEIELIAVSKTKSVQEIEKVINEDHFSFGENKLQEIEDKWVTLKDTYPQVRLHYLGAIQSRKINSIHKYCDVIHSLDRFKIVNKFNELEAQSHIKREYFIQINTGNEQQKAGVLFSDADQFIGECLSNYQINIIGLMCLPPVEEDPKKHFKNLRTLAEKFNLKSLSMGMSGDYEHAINAGSTHIRIGTNIFGKRI